MGIFQKVAKYIKNPAKVIVVLNSFGLARIFPDRFYLRCLYWANFEKKLDLKNPKTFNEKLQWLKLYDRNPEYTKMVDKYEVKKLVAERIGEEYIIPTLGVWDRFEDIDFDTLPNQFVLKSTHDSGSYVICKNKAKFDVDAAGEKLRASLKRNYFWHGREWPYKNVKPRIIAEQYMTDSGDGATSDSGLTDYKFYCFHGVADCVMTCVDRHLNDVKFYFFDKQWNLKRINKLGKTAPEGFSIRKPECIDDMFRIAESLSKDIPFARVDLYECNGKAYFGEITLYPSSGCDPNYLPETDRYFGDLIRLNINIGE